ncbi:hypothetical protein [Buttiauxella gaviniae]|uniref:hypothetical protein n=1 Tax=Buttiauxella gaviniae TaxID=82990 RepID=UPI0039AFA9A7
MYQQIAILILILDFFLIYKVTNAPVFNGKNWIGFKYFVLSRKNGFLICLCILSAMGYPALEIAVNITKAFFG